jgi:hypothetical protein
MTRRWIVVLVGFSWTGLASKADEVPVAARRVQIDLNNMHAWLGSGENGQRWRTYLLSDRVQKELDRRENADPAVLTLPLARYRSVADGQDRRKFAAVRTSLAAWQASLLADREADLPALARAFGGQFAPVTEVQVTAALQELQRRLLQLELYLSRQGGNGQAWRKYLLLDVLKEQLAAEMPDFVALGDVFRRFRAVHEGLELPVFARVADALERYVNLANIARAENQSRQYARQLDILAQELDAYTDQPAEERAFNLGRRLGFVDALGQASALVQAVRRRLARPNLRAHVSDELLAAASAQPVRDTRPVTDVILGTYIRGTATTDASLVARPANSGAGAGRIELVLEGSVWSNTVGRNGPVCIYSTGQTPFASLKTVYIDQYGIHELPACTNATTCTNIHSIQPVKSGLGSKLIERIAWKRAAQQKSQAEAIAADHAEDRISQGFNAQTLSLLANAQANYNRRIRLPLVRRNEFPEYFNVQTGSEGLTIRVLQATRSQLGAPTAPPQLQPEYDLSLAVHESLSNNLANSMLSGYHLTDEWLRERLRNEKGELPEELQGDQDPWSITFDTQRPVSVEFDDDGFTVTIRGRRFTSGDNTYGAMNITARYDFVTTDAGVLLRRQGDLEILPPGFRPGEDRLSAEQTALREILIKRLGEVFKPEIQGEGIALPGELSRVGRLLPVVASSDEGWLHLAWNRGRAKTVVAQAAAAAKLSRGASTERASSVSN